MRVGEHVMATFVEADASGATAVPGVWVAGNVADPRAQVITSAAAGLTTAGALNAELINEDTELAVARYRTRPTASQAGPPARVRGPDGGVGLSTEQVASSLHRDSRDVLVSEDPERTVTDDDGEERILRDVVGHARRRG
jgi:hypothetical protein